MKASFIPQGKAIFVDVDDTLVRTVRGNRFPVPDIVETIGRLSRAGATLYCWSRGGGDYAREVAGELGIDHCFAAFLPKPDLLIDDQPVQSWHHLREVHPFECGNLLP